MHSKKNMNPFLNIILFVLWIIFDAIVPVLIIMGLFYSGKFVLFYHWTDNFKERVFGLVIWICFCFCVLRFWGFLKKQKPNRIRTGTAENRSQEFVDNMDYQHQEFVRRHEQESVQHMREHQEFMDDHVRYHQDSMNNQ